MPYDPYDPRRRQPSPSDPWAPIQTAEPAAPLEPMPVSDILQSGAVGEGLIQRMQAEEAQKRAKQQQAASTILRLWLGGGG